MVNTQASLAGDIVAFYRGWRAFEERHKGRFHGLWVVINDLAATGVAPIVFEEATSIAAALAVMGQYRAYASDPFFCQSLVFYPSLKSLKRCLALPSARLSQFAQELLSFPVGPKAMGQLVERHVS